MQLFEILSSYTIFKQLFNMLATKNQNHNQNWPFMTKDMNFLIFTLWPFQAKRLAGGIYHNFLFFPVLAH